MQKNLKRANKQTVNSEVRAKSYKQQVHKHTVQFLSMEQEPNKDKWNRTIFLVLLLFMWEEEGRKNMNVWKTKIVSKFSTNGTQWVLLRKYNWLTIKAFHKIIHIMKLTGCQLTTWSSIDHVNVKHAPFPLPSMWTFIRIY